MLSRTGAVPWRGCRSGPSRSRSTGFASRTSGRARDRRSSFCTATSATGGARGAASSMGSRTSSRSSHGTRPAWVGRRIHLRSSGCRTTRIAWPGSWTRSGWNGRTSPGCRSAEGSRSSSIAGTHRSLGRWSWRRPTRGGRAPFRTRRSTGACSRSWTWPTCRLIDSWAEVRPTLFSESTPAETVAEFAINASGFHPAGLRAMAHSIAEADLRDVLPEIGVPTLLLYGENDARAPRRVADDIHAAIPSSKLVVLPGTGHVVNIEAWERFNAEVRAFLRVRPGEPAASSAG